MPLIGFTVLKAKILSGEKRQTIRKARKYPPKVGDKLYLYWRLRQPDCQKLGEAVCTSCERVSWNILKRLLLFTGLPYSDGFETREEAITWFEKTHVPSDETQFDIIQWER